MSNKTKGSAAKKARYTAYNAKGSALKNAKRKLERHVKKHPNDEQGAAALKAGLNAIRKPSGTRLGWVQEEVKSFLNHTPPSRALARQVAQILSFSKKISRMQRTKAEQALRRKDGAKKAN